MSIYISYSPSYIQSARMNWFDLTDWSLTNGEVLAMVPTNRCSIFFCITNAIRRHASNRWWWTKLTEESEDYPYIYKFMRLSNGEVFAMVPTDLYPIFKYQIGYYSPSFIQSMRMNWFDWREWRLSNVEGVWNSIKGPHWHPRKTLLESSKIVYLKQFRCRFWNLVLLSKNQNCLF